MFSNNNYHYLIENDIAPSLNSSIYIDSPSSDIPLQRTFTVKDDCVTHHTSINLPFSSSIKIHIPPHKINQILEISNLLTYDQDSQNLSSHTNSIANNIALLYLAAKATVGELSTKKIKDKDLVHLYLNGKGKPTTHIKNSLIRIIYKNIGKHHTPKKSKSII